MIRFVKSFAWWPMLLKTICFLLVAIAIAQASFWIAYFIGYRK